MIRERKCPECGAAFTPRYGNQVCCTTRCQENRRKRQFRECPRNEFAHEVRRKENKARKAMLARLAARDAAYIREYGHPSGRPRGRLAAPLAPSLFPVEPGASTL